MGPTFESRSGWFKDGAPDLTRSSRDHPAGGPPPQQPPPLDTTIPDMHRLAV